MRAEVVRRAAMQSCCVMRRVFLYVPLLVVAAGCATSMQIGTPPSVERLPELKLGVSSSSDISRVLGEPNGQGAARLPKMGHQLVWVYEATSLQGSKASLSLLAVFVDPTKGVYQGHMWFSSASLYGQVK